MKKNEVIKRIWEAFGPKNDYDLTFHHKYIYVSEILPNLEQDYSRITILSARKLLGVRAGHIAGRHIWWSPRTSLNFLLTPRLRMDEGRKKRRRDRQTNNLLPKFKAFMTDMGFAVEDKQLFKELKSYVRPNSFTYAALSGVKKALGMMLFDYKGKKYRIWPDGELRRLYGGVEGTESIGSWIEGCFEIKETRELSEKQLIEMGKKNEQPIHASVILYTLSREFKRMPPDHWGSRTS